MDMEQLLMWLVLIAGILTGINGLTAGILNGLTQVTLGISGLTVQVLAYLLLAVGGSYLMWKEYAEG